jgi:hypothetical protein
MNDETGGRWRLAVLVAAAALAAVVLAACSGAGAAPRVASLGASPGPGTGSGTGTDTAPGSDTAPAGSGASSGSTPASLPGNVTPLLNQWAACERANGDPDQADPTVDANGVIWVMVPQGAQPAGDLHELTGTCSQYLAKAQNELRAANPVQPPPDNAEYLKWVNCVRANGVPDYPYPTGDTTNFVGSGVNPDSPSVVRAGQLCGKKLGLPAWWVNGSYTPGSIEVRTAGMPANPTPPACVYQKVDPCTGDKTLPPGATPSRAPAAGSNG